MRRQAMTLVIGLMLATVARAEDESIPLPGNPPVKAHGPIQFARELVAAEEAFEARSVAAGPAVAMRDYMDAVDGLSFAGGEPARGAAAIFTAQGGDKPSGMLTWVPSEVFAATGGDMGAVWGHFRYVAPPGEAAKPLTGKYVTVWRKNADGHWKGILDIGNPD